MSLGSVAITCVLVFGFASWVLYRYLDNKSNNKLSLTFFVVALFIFLVSSFLSGYGHAQKEVWSHIWMLDIATSVFSTVEVPLAFMALGPMLSNPQVNKKGKNVPKSNFVELTNNNETKITIVTGNTTITIDSKS